MDGSNLVSHVNAGITCILCVKSQYLLVLSACFSTLDLGGSEADSDDWEEREALRHGVAVLENLVPPDKECALLHAAGRAPDVTA